MSRSTISTFQLFAAFPDEETARQYLEGRLWADGVKCPECKAKERITKRKDGYYRCNPCKIDFTVRTGTIFERSHVPLHKWLYAMYLVVTSRKGISSLQLAKEIGVTQKSAWFMLQRLRLALRDTFYGSKLGSGPDSEVEVDETYIGGKARNMHKSSLAYRRRTGAVQEDKVTVMGFIERGGSVRTQIVRDRLKTTLQPEVRKHVQAGAALYTDAHGAYRGLDAEYKHQVVDHAVKYVDGRVSTNTLENFWSLLKRGLHGTYVSVEPFHLFRYLDEQMFRFNNRKYMNDSQRFKMAMGQVSGKRLTYTELTAKDSSPRHETTRTGEAELPF